MIFGWPNMRISTDWLNDGTRYSEYIGLNGSKYFVYQGHQQRPPLFILLPLIGNSTGWKHDEVRYEIRQEQPH